MRMSSTSGMSALMTGLTGVSYPAVDDDEDKC